MNCAKKRFSRPTTVTTVKHTKNIAAEDCYHSLGLMSLKLERISLSQVQIAAEHFYIAVKVLPVVGGAIVINVEHTLQLTVQIFVKQLLSQLLESI